MSTLPEIEAAVDALPIGDQQELLVFLAGRLRQQAGAPPLPRTFSGEQMQAWIAQDEADLQRFRSGASE
jgi:hypothetical protein